MDRLVDWLAEELRKHNMSMRELARRAGVSHTTVAEVMAGQRKPTWEFCAAIARPLAVDPSDIFYLAGLFSVKPGDGDLDITHDELAAMNLVRQAKGKEPVTFPEIQNVAEEGRELATEGDYWTSEWWRIWPTLSDSERIKAIRLLEDLKEEREQMGHTEEIEEAKEELQRRKS